ncbi:MAG: nitrate reductase maturation protein NarM [Acaryochloridaceae cyanobacterium SU_2_1]|nr:nitrate reductase maturation protein NarM [Acaryochloridaceae cyanobacterium SU_2_1]
MFDPTFSADSLCFAFEQEFLDDLRCIPMVVRFKLDTCGIKLKLAEWHQFAEDEREQLIYQPCSAADEIVDYRAFLQDLVLMYTAAEASTLTVEEHPAWLDSRAITSSVQAQAAHFDVTLTLSQWQALTPLQRFALIKLSRSSHENKNFLPALKEFNLL